jgi:hypothetical protein
LPLPKQDPTVIQDIIRDILVEEDKVKLHSTLYKLQGALVDILGAAEALAERIKNQETTSRNGTSRVDISNGFKRLP